MAEGTTEPKCELDRIEEETYLRDTATQKTLVVEELDYDVDREGIPEGIVVLRTMWYDEVQERDAEELDFQMHDHKVLPLPDRVVDNPDEVVQEFASVEFGKYRSATGPQNDFNGIEGINCIAEIGAAITLAKMNSESE